ncbi:hypothetical protein G6F31_012489 [Rhizopus arrhizus]|nr:hypothetical protein G6F31_012489 [Rhizopus arrhizus]
MYFLDVGDLQVVGSSPEILVRLQHTDDGVGEVTVRPIAGTRPRGATVEQDLALEAELLADPKERAEHLMLIDLGRNDAGRVSKAGTVEVGEQFVIERYSHVMHIVSEVTGQLQPGLSYADVLRATFPAGTVSGAPKIRALEVIRELEPIKRNVYAGSIGYIGWHGDADTAIAIRTAVIKDGRLYVQAGAGIVYDSDPDKEWDETMNKGRALFRAVAQAAKGLQGVPHEAAERIAVVVTAGHDGPVCVGAGQHHSLAAAPAGEGRGAPRGDAGPVRPAAEHRRDRHGCRCRAAPRAGQRRPRAGAVQASRQVFMGTRVSRQLRASFASVKAMQDVLGALKANENVQVSSVAPTYSGEVALRRELKGEAAAQTRESAQGLAKAYGTKLRGLYSISDVAPNFAYGVQAGNWPRVDDTFAPPVPPAPQNSIEATGSNIRESIEAGPITYTENVFTYNLVQYLQTLGAEVKVVRNDAMSVDEIAAQKPERIVISPGPCTPNEAGVSLELIERLGPTTPILGVCLGHQGIGQVYGGTVIRAGNIMHGKTSPIRHQGKGVFAGLPDRYQATRYHSLVVDKNRLPDCLEVTAWTENDDGSIEEIMGLRHRQFPVEGVQFHPESILTEHGHALLRNFLNLA